MLSSGRPVSFVKFIHVSGKNVVLQILVNKRSAFSSLRMQGRPLQRNEVQQVLANYSLVLIGDSGELFLADLGCQMNFFGQKHLQSSCRILYFDIRCFLLNNHEKLRLGRAY